MTNAAKTSVRVDEHMTQYPTITSRHTSVLSAIDYMSKNGIRHMPVVEDNKVVGVVSDRDLKQAEILSDSMTLVVADFMSSHPYCVKVGTPLGEVSRTMAEKKYGCAVVTNQLGQVVGIFTTTDALKVLADILAQERGREVMAWGIERLLSGSELI